MPSGKRRPFCVSRNVLDHYLMPSVVIDGDFMAVAEDRELSYIYL